MAATYRASFFTAAVAGAVGLLTAVGRCSEPNGSPAATETSVDFVEHVLPIFRDRCFECHATGSEEGELNLGIRDRALAGGSEGAVIVPGDSAASPLIRRVTSVDEHQVMPPEGERLTDRQVAILRAWIDQGAPWPDGADVLDPRLDRAKAHWAFQPLSLPELPDVVDASWPVNPIDRFVLAALEAQGLQPSPPVAAEKLVRRMTMDMHGLPPSPEELSRSAGVFAQDRRTAIGELADALLAGHHYGERWGRHWLDVARYADSNGQEGDQDRPYAYRYRDFVIRALNDDLPYDDFVRLQLAGDECRPDDPAAPAATGFLIAGPHTVLADTLLEEERLRNRYNELDDMLSTIGTGLLGLSIGCARCHDHKYDAVSAAEYYSLMSAFHGGDRQEIQLETDGSRLVAFRDASSQPAPTWLFRRGDFNDRERPVQLDFPAVLLRGRTAGDYWSDAQADRPQADSSYQRKALAEWITDVDHGAGALSARVIVNRIWQHHFGEGLVRTVNDFGVRGQAPTHPELLEWLAADFVDNGRQLKRLHRMILTSATYQQSSVYDPAKARIDPDNRLLWRMPLRRLEAELLRDAMLAAGGTLNLQAYGPAFRPMIPAEARIARNLKSPYPDEVEDSADVRRRSVYMFHKRVIPYPLLQAFDRPDSLQSCGRREQTIVAPQALALLNDPFVRAAAGDFAALLIRSAGDDDSELVELAFQRAVGRRPGDVEQRESIRFLESQFRQRQSRQADASGVELRRQAVTDFCQTLFGLNEFLYVD